MGLDGTHDYRPTDDCGRCFDRAKWDPKNIFCRVPRGSVGRPGRADRWPLLVPDQTHHRHYAPGSCNERSWITVSRRAPTFTVAIRIVVFASAPTPLWPSTKSTSSLRMTFVSWEASPSSTHYGIEAPLLLLTFRKSPLRTLGTAGVVLASLFLLGGASRHEQPEHAF
ncbi:hypothetical protein BC834DRAFT_46178 [Gloeopeniophorella convolvens]|nr:hypothetical protein BC834DRAFT_46178 [Gloeopeniophorella convolvens]